MSTVIIIRYYLWWNFRFKVGYIYGFKLNLSKVFDFQCGLCKIMILPSILITNSPSLNIVSYPSRRTLQAWHCFTPIGGRTKICESVFSTVYTPKPTIQQNLISSIVIVSVIQFLYLLFYLFQTHHFFISLIKNYTIILGDEIFVNMILKFI